MTAKRCRPSAALRRSPNRPDSQASAERDPHPRSSRSRPPGLGQFLPVRIGSFVVAQRVLRCAEIARRVSPALAPNAKLRALVVPQGDACARGAGHRSRSRRLRGRDCPGPADRTSWARLLKRVFDIDIQHCPNCGGGELKIIAAILKRRVIEKKPRALEDGATAVAQGPGTRARGASRCLSRTRPTADFGHTPPQAASCGSGIRAGSVLRAAAIRACRTSRPSG